jgi:hypothetical protein
MIHYTFGIADLDVRDCSLWAASPWSALALAALIAMLYLDAAGSAILAMNRFQRSYQASFLESTLLKRIHGRKACDIALSALALLL